MGQRSKEKKQIFEMKTSLEKLNIQSWKGNEKQAVIQEKR